MNSKDRGTAVIETGEDFKWNYELKKNENIAQQTFIFARHQSEMRKASLVHGMLQQISKDQKTREHM